MQWGKDSGGQVTAAGTIEELQSLRGLIAENFGEEDSMVEVLDEVVATGEEIPLGSMDALRVQDPHLLAEMMRHEGNPEQQNDGQALADLIGVP